jgi:polyisoprenyl-teichoic acid--peptidoglycan teichoic acid transferase
MSNPPLAPRYSKPAREKRGASSPGGAPPKRRRHVAEYLMFGFVAALIAIAAIAAYSHFAPAMKEVPNRVAEGFERDRINLVLIGIGGDTHPGEGKDLADSIMLLSLKPSTRQVAIISLPRDLYVPMDKGVGMQRLNAAHSLGARVGFPGEGPGFLVHTVEKVLGEPVHGYARVDFLAFEKVIDALGGIDVYVYRPFYDYLFKDGFNKGWHHLNGKRALRYARYRHIRASYEGNNFGRELRQQQVLDAIRNKLKNLDAGQILRLSKLAMSSSRFTSTNLTTTQMVELYSTFRNTKRQDVRHVSLKQFTRIVNLTEPHLLGEAVAPPQNDYTKIRTVVRTIFDGKGAIVAPSEIQLTDVGAPPQATVAAAVGR